MRRPTRKGLALAAPIAVVALGWACIAHLDAAASTRTAILLTFMVLTVAAGPLHFGRASKRDL